MAGEKRRKRKETRKTICCLRREARCTHRSQCNRQSTEKKEKEKITLKAERKSNKDQDPIVKVQPARASGMDLGVSWINPGVPAVLSEEEG